MGREERKRERKERKRKRAAADRDLCHCPSQGVEVTRNASDFSISFHSIQWSVFDVISTSGRSDLLPRVKLHLPAIHPGVVVVAIIIDSSSSPSSLFVWHQEERKKRQTNESKGKDVKRIKQHEWHPTRSRLHGSLEASEE